MLRNLGLPLILLLLISCVPQLPPDAEPPRSAQVEATPAPLPPEAQAVIDLSPARINATYPSPDGLWLMEVVIYDCVAISEDMTMSYEVLRLRHLTGKPERVVASQLINCGGLGAFGLEGKAWSADSATFTYTDAREGVPDGLGDWQPPIYTYYLAEDRSERVVEGMTSPEIGNRDHVAYVLDGDIWVKALPDGLPQRLTTDGVNDTPQWAVSGQYLAFRKLESQVWIHSFIDGHTIAVEGGAPVSQFAWSPREDILATIMGSGILHLRLYDPAEQASDMIMPPSSQELPAIFMWSPKGDAIALLSRVIDDANQASDRLQVITLPAGERQILLATDPMRERSLILASWATDAESLYFSYGPRLVDSFLPETLTLYEMPLIPGGEPEIVAETVSWLHLADIAPGPDGSPSTGDPALAYVATSETISPQTTITLPGVDLTPPWQHAIEPTWSPDGQTIAYAGLPREGDQADTGMETFARSIWLVDAYGGRSPRLLTGDPAYDDEEPAWSGDGESIRFARRDGKGRSSLWSVSRRGGEALLLVEQIDVMQPQDMPNMPFDRDRNFAWWIASP